KNKKIKNKIGSVNGDLAEVKPKLVLAMGTATNSLLVTMKGPYRIYLVYVAIMEKKITREDQEPEERIVHFSSSGANNGSVQNIRNLGDVDGAIDTMISQILSEIEQYV